jgi:hypothetical protein
MYDGKTQLLIENPINRYLINSPMLPYHEDECRWVAHTLHPEGFAGQADKESELASRTERSHLPGHATLLAQEDAAVDLARG